VIGANACAAALLDRLRCGKGREIHASRIAGGLSAIGAASAFATWGMAVDGASQHPPLWTGALCLKQRGLPPHLDPVPAIYKSEADILAKRRGIEPSELDAYKQAAISDPAKQAWLFQRLYPFMAPYKCSDGEFGHTSPHLGHTLATLWPHFGHTSATTRPQLGHNSAALRTGEWILPMATFNRRLATGYCAYLGFADDVSAFGIVDRDPYDPASAPFDDRNLALPIGFNFPSSCKVAELFEAKFLQKTALEWEAELEAAGLPCAVIQTWEAWMRDPDARAARIFAEVGGEVQLGRAAWVKSAGEYPDLQPMVDGAAAVARDRAAPPPAATAPPRQRPLEGFVICDFANVLAPSRLRRAAAGAASPH